MSIYTTSEARSNLYKIIDQVAEGHEPVYIKGRRHSAVLISEEDYASLQETLYLQSIPGLAKSILDASSEPLAEFTEHSKIKW
ncbi:MAG: type II toxin-antitoxin system Phd/YefM family antitoxin [Pseudomonadota bacterium]